jgi:hypothetical protein
MLKFSKIISFKSKKILKENSGYLRIFSFVEMNVSKLINYSTDMCWNGQGTMVWRAVEKLLPNRLPCEGMKLGEGLLGVTNPKKSNALERETREISQPIVSPSWEISQIVSRNLLRCD